VPSATITEAPTDPALFDYGSLGQEVAMTPTPLGSISWISSGSVPGQWILDGFPSPEPQPLPPGHPLTEREFVAAERSAPCCLVLQPIDTGLVGLGSTEWQDDNEAEFPSTWREARLLDMPCEAREWQGHANEIWFTADGVSWELLAEDVFGPEGLNMCHISMHVAEHNGTWLIIAAWPSDEVDSATDLVALTSTDLVIWDEIPLDMNHPGMQSNDRSPEYRSGLTMSSGWPGHPQTE
jgi:hypothetical protein